MADMELVDQLKQGVREWNLWRRKHLHALPDLREVVLTGIVFREADFSGANLSGADLREADLTKADFNGANLSGADLTRAILGGANLSRAALSRANLSGANLREADLSGATLSFATLSRVNLSGANLSRATLNRVNLSDADLSGVNFSGAALRRANLSGANLSGATLHRADLSGATLRGATLRGADLRRVRLFETVFSENDLSAVKGLVEIDHSGPSRVELYSVKLPQDGSALHFLRGTGVPNEWIDFYRGSMMMPIQYHSCFISYAHQDETLARRLHADLQDQGVRCWFAPEDMKIGDKIRARINEAIHLHEKLLLVISKHAVASSWVEAEVEAALEKENLQKRSVLFPIRIDESVLLTKQAWAATVRQSRHIGDFTRWTHPQHYQYSFERLLRDLKAET